MSEWGTIIAEIDLSLTSLVSHSAMSAHRTWTPKAKRSRQISTDQHTNITKNSHVPHHTSLEDNSNSSQAPLRTERTATQSAPHPANA
eukprot:2083151-Rhodomonas_salina.1